MKLGHTILRFDRVESTNDIARDLAASGASEGLVVVAGEQTAGRGRHGRSWASPAGEGLYVSIILRPDIAPAKASVITLGAAVAVAEMLVSNYALKVDIKWPNDVLVSRRKISGILVESAIENDRIQYAVLGIGMNVGQEAFAAGLAETATSLRREVGREISCDEVLKALLKELDRWYRESTTRARSVISRWEELSSYARGRAVRVTSAAGLIEGATRGLSASGALLVETEAGQLVEVVSGEVSVRATGASS